MVSRSIKVHWTVLKTSCPVERVKFLYRFVKPFRAPDVQLRAYKIAAMPDYISRETWAAIVTVLLTVTSTIFIGLRLVVRFFMVRNPGKDDLFCFIAGVSQILFPIML